MKKSNWLAFIIAIIISAFLLWLWFFLGFNHIDYPLDLVLSIIWWIIVAVACYVIYRVEKKRQERARTCYVADNYIYNSEAGSYSAESPEEAVQRMHDVIKELEYTFDVKDMPKDPKFNFVVRSKKFKITQEADEANGTPEELEWEGEVSLPERPDDNPTPFGNRDELLKALVNLA
ncbi:MAG: hypothetical protein IJ111_09390 [Eggerthellaceae bacterium]|nr:hypothetical protein [Eggerthellaceae bacterium]